MKKIVAKIWLFGLVTGILGLMQWAMVRDLGWAGSLVVWGIAVAFILVLCITIWATENI